MDNRSENPRVFKGNAKHDYETEAWRAISDYIDTLGPPDPPETRQDLLTQALVYAVLDVAQAIRDRP